MTRIQIQTTSWYLSIAEKRSRRSISLFHHTALNIVPIVRANRQYSSTFVIQRYKFVLRNRSQRFANSVINGHPGIVLYLCTTINSIRFKRAHSEIRRMSIFCNEYSYPITGRTLSVNFSKLPNRVVHGSRNEKTCELYQNMTRF